MDNFTYTLFNSPRRTGKTHELVKVFKSELEQGLDVYYVCAWEALSRELETQFKLPRERILVNPPMEFFRGRRGIYLLLDEPYSMDLSIINEAFQLGIVVDVFGRGTKPITLL